MTIDKAIEILDTHQCDMPRNQVPDLIDAIKLGIEALKLVQRMNRGAEIEIHPLLPSETEE